MREHRGAAFLVRAGKVEMTALVPARRCGEKTVENFAQPLDFLIAGNPVQRDVTVLAIVTNLVGSETEMRSHKPESYYMRDEAQMNIAA